MARLLAIDYGRRRCGIAVTDPMQIVASALSTVATNDLIDFVKRYCAENEVEAIIVGNPTTLRGEPSESMRYITPGINRLAKELPEMPVIRFDERFTSTLAHRAMIDGGMKKSDRRDKAVVDRIAATIILNDYLQSRAYSATHPAGTTLNMPS
ncbi:MAG: Holliday junction resolvase RuvX [Muribaculaceae bacterium]|nr:Holliday junction resolvase RuvX [Muribaculaceae bacterium]MDE5967791.1 Holliday junction resolvase RuvX [Muribaculaceae bacterium]